MSSPPKKQTIPLEQVVQSLYRKLDVFEWRDTRPYGEITVRTQEVADFLAKYLDDDAYDDHPCTLGEGDPARELIGQYFTFCFHPVRGPLGVVLRNADDLLRYRHDVLYSHGRQPWYLVGEDVGSWEPLPASLEKLPSVRRLVAHLDRAAIIFDRQSDELIFLRDRRFDVPLRCGVIDLANLDCARLDALVNELDRHDGHEEQRLDILASAVFEMLQSVSKGDRFPFLLRSIADLHQRFITGYRLFASSFSFEALRKDVEAFYIDHIGKIHKTLSDIQGQLLGVPVSTIVVATQLKPVSAEPSNLWINCAVLVGALIFCILLVVSVLNQIHTLHVLDEDVKQKQASLRDTLAGLEERLGRGLEKLRSRIQIHRIALLAVVCAALVGLLIAFAVFWQLSRDAI